MSVSIAETVVWRALQRHAVDIAASHLRDLLADSHRSLQMVAEHDGIVLDYSRQNANLSTVSLLLDLAHASDLKGKLRAMAAGEPINRSENRSVLHIALRANASDRYTIDGHNVVPDVLAARERIRKFAEEVRTGKWLGTTGKPLRNVIAVGIGGSYLGTSFVAEALRTEPKCAAAAEHRRLRFLANIDPIDLARATHDLNPEETLVVVISKTFTTTETMLNARSLRDWLTSALGSNAVRQHMVAVSTNLPAVAAFGIDTDHAFGFWDWVGGRYSVCSSVGLLPLALHFGCEPMQQFLDGARSIDQHLLSAPFDRNLPVLLGLFGVWNASFLHRPVRALLPYCQALKKFTPHIQQVDMESNGKRVDIEGRPLQFEAGEFDFGEPGTNSQHSFYQLIHQGRVIPADFIGFRRSQRPYKLADNELDNHDELMANFFAQPDALALGKTAEHLRAEGVNEDLIPHREFPGNRPSNVLLLDQLDAYSTGQLLALYEHRTAVQGFVWGINSFDQWGVELGKVLATELRGHFGKRRKGEAATAAVPASTQRLLQRYFGN
ncbi:glucose-6-phosphate isomerase [Permianibacter sp. IMCC34836]|uniref:glucose-6-phosphate isomerase n=1 Tax=Permianibacter fluminis TaxID=2738515 RepID=UPI001552AA3B|nr:glucose-6-phosphate isomerase [Permianibacter fluminis]NQD37492.1 glucose-6-phosphate isomerase [Permianibacter fluminis]